MAAMKWRSGSENEENSMKTRIEKPSVKSASAKKAEKRKLRKKTQLAEI
jgi:hypothetical protein